MLFGGITGVSILRGKCLGEGGRSHGLGFFLWCVWGGGGALAHLFMVGWEDGIYVELSGDRGLSTQSEVYSFLLQLLGDDTSRRGTEAGRPVG